MQTSSIVDVCQGTEYTSVFYHRNLFPGYLLPSSISNIQRQHQVWLKFRALYSYIEANEKVVDIHLSDIH